MKDDETERQKTEEKTYGQVQEGELGKGAGTMTPHVVRVEQLLSRGRL
jgi:hypothetical protein